MSKDHKIKQGECILSIAKQHGFFWETLWNHPKNAQLKQHRKDPSVLFPGDVVHIPDKVLGEESVSTESRHKFLVKGKTKLKIKILGRPEKEESPVELTSEEPGVFMEPEIGPLKTEPKKNQPFILYADGEQVAEGSTDGQGYISANVPPNAKRGRLIMNPGTPQEHIITMNMGDLDPANEVAGVCKRLANLGYQCPTDSKTLTPAITAAIQRFQADNDLEVTGKIDQALQDKLVQLHGL